MFESGFFFGWFCVLVLNIKLLFSFIDCTRDDEIEIKTIICVLFIKMMMKKLTVCVVVIRHYFHPLYNNRSFAYCNESALVNIFVKLF